MRQIRNVDAMLKILDSLPAMVGYWDTDLRNRFSNNAYSKWFGKSPEEIAGRHIREVLGEDLYEKNLPYIERAMRGQRQEFERTIPTPDGSGVRYSLAEYIPDIIDGKVQGFVVQVSDVSAVKRAEIALQEANRQLQELEDRHRTILEDQAEVISRLTGEGVYIYANEVFLRFFGKTKESLIGSKWQPIVHPDDLERVGKELSMLSPDNPLVMIENRVFSGDGQVYWMEFSNRGIFDATGKLIEIQSVGRDMTKRKALEDILKQSEERFRILTESSLVGIYILQDGRYAYVNPKMASIFGYTVAEMIGMTPRQIVRQEDLDMVAEKIRQRIDGEVRTANYEVRGLHRDGSTRNVEVFGSRMELNGKTSLVGTLIDITERKKAEKMRREYLEQAIRAIADTVEARDPYTSGHQYRVSQLATAIAGELGLDEDRIHGLRLAASIHDLGKVQVPAEILSKPSKLTALEYKMIQEHPETGYNIMKDIKFPWPIADIVRQHHEKIDGTGYPLGLKGDQIQLEARILMVADVVEAMASHRPYRAALGIEKALAEIERGRGTAYDPAVADACLRLFRERGYAIPA